MLHEKISLICTADRAISLYTRALLLHKKIINLFKLAGKKFFFRETHLSLSELKDTEFVHAMCNLSL